MNTLIKSAKVINPGSSFHGKTVDILIERGVIAEIKSSIKAEKGIRIVESDNLHVSAGWLDMQACFEEPGYEHRETISSGCAAAAQGGFTGVCVMPSTNPPIDNKSQVKFLIDKSGDELVNVFPVGCISAGREGKDLAEMFDMKMAGAIAFSDYKRAVKEPGLLLRALQYAGNIGGLVMPHCEEKSLSNGGQMNEGPVSTALGLKGIPGLAEELMVERNISVLNYAGGRMHIPLVSTRGSVERIRRAKNDGMQISAGVAAVSLLLDDTCLSDFDTNYKLNPPLRSKDEVESLRKAVINGSIDVIVSDHSPVEIEGKDVEFDHADFGMVSLECTYALANTALGDKINQDDLIAKFTQNPYRILGLTLPKIEVGEKANLTLFDPSIEWVFSQAHIQSKSANSPVIGRKLKGKPIGVINKNSIYVSI